MIDPVKTLEALKAALELESRARSVASMHCNGNAGGLCAAAEFAAALEAFDAAIALLKAERASLATAQALHEQCGRCPWGAPHRT